MFIKYPRTYHLPWSEGITRDDRVLKNIDNFIGKNVVITEKMDGENSTLYPDGSSHARSIDSRNHESRNWLKKFWSERSFLSDDNNRVCGENLFAKHSIHYKELSSYFYGFSVWNNDMCLSWLDTIKYFKKLNIVPVKEIYSGIFDPDMRIKLSYNMEGYVIRLMDSFNINDFQYSVAKFVRKNHVTTDQHWMNSKIIKNELKWHI
jgi:hypothetical protein